MKTLLLQPLENGGVRVSASFHLCDCLHHVDDAANGDQVGCFLCQIVNCAEFFEFPFILGKFVVVLIIGMLLINR